MRKAIGDVVELIRPHPAVLLREALRDAAEIPGIRVRLFRHRDDLRTERPQKGDLLLRLRLGNHDHHAIPTRAAEQRQANTRVAGRAFDDGVARLQVPAALRLADDAQRRAVFHRAAGIHELRLAEDSAARQFGEPPQPDQRRVPDAPLHAMICVTRHAPL